MAGNEKRAERPVFIECLAEAVRFTLQAVRLYQLAFVVLSLQSYPFSYHSSIHGRGNWPENELEFVSQTLAEIGHSADLFRFRGSS